MVVSLLSFQVVRAVINVVKLVTLLENVPAKRIVEGEVRKKDR